jgi:hypothetical protein
MPQSFCAHFVLIVLALAEVLAELAQALVYWPFSAIKLAVQWTEKRNAFAIQHEILLYFLGNF